MGTSSLRLFRYGQAPRRAVLATAAWLAAGLLLAAPALADTGGTAPPEPSAPKRPKPPPPESQPSKPKSSQPQSTSTQPAKPQPARPRTPIDQPPPVPVSGDLRTRIV